MHSLVLIRHAKSSWRHEQASDLLRPLGGRGYRQLQQLLHEPLLAAHLPDRLLCSPAVRCYSTALALVQGLGIEEDRLQLLPELYEAEGEALWQLLRKKAMAARSQCCWLVSHSPGLDQLVELLTGEDGHKVATGQITVLQSTSWLPGQYQISASWKPR